MGFRKTNKKGGRKTRRRFKGGAETSSELNNRVFNEEFEKLQAKIAEVKDMKWEDFNRNIDALNKAKRSVADAYNKDHVKDSDDKIAILKDVKDLIKKKEEEMKAGRLTAIEDRLTALEKQIST